MPYFLPVLSAKLFLAKTKVLVCQVVCDSKIFWPSVVSFVTFSQDRCYLFTFNLSGQSQVRVKINHFIFFGRQTFESIQQCQHTDDSVSEFYKSMDIQTDDGESVSTSFHGCAGEEMKLMHTFPQWLRSINQNQADFNICPGNWRWISLNKTFLKVLYSNTLNISLSVTLVLNGLHVNLIKTLQQDNIMIDWLIGLFKCQTPYYK